VATLVDTNILVYRSMEAIIEFVAAVTRPIRGCAILKQSEEAEEFFIQFTVSLPKTKRLCGMRFAAYRLSWFDAHRWSYAEHYGLPEILGEDLQLAFMAPCA
jgi:hypothetical protein